MKYLFSLSPLVQSDLQEAYDYYENALYGLGEDFLAEIDIAFTQIQRNPFAFEVLHLQTRKCNMHRFPYAIYFIIVEKEIIVSAVVHLMRFEDAWKNRL